MPRAPEPWDGRDWPPRIHPLWWMVPIAVALFVLAIVADKENRAAMNAELRCIRNGFDTMRVGGGVMCVDRRGRIAVRPEP